MPNPPPRSLAPALAATALVAAAALSGCAQAQLERSRAETGEILRGVEDRVERERAEALAATAPADTTPEEGAKPPDVMTLADALTLALRQNRDLRSDREGLVLSAVALRNARRDVEPRLFGSVAWLLEGQERVESDRTDSARLGVSDVLPTGAEVAVTGAASRSHGRADGADSAADASVTASIRQPLLRGGGYETSHEALTDAEREALYDVRDFALSRQDLALQVQREFFGLVAQKQVIRNRERSLGQFEFLRRRSERLFEVDRVSEVDKFRATREFLSAQNDLIDAQQEFDARMDRLKILLGLDTEVTFDVAEEIPEVPEGVPGMTDAILVSLRNRLELMTARDQVEDAERRLRIRDRNLLPDVDLTASATRRGGGERSLRDLSVDDDSYSVGVEVDLPLDRVRERGELRRARIELRRARRRLSLLEDRVMLEVRDSLRNYRSAVNSLAIQRQIATSEDKNARVAKLRFDEGEIGNRDYTDALSNLADAQDRVVREQVNVQIAHTQLLRDLGVLVLDEDGRWWK